MKILAISDVESKAYWDFYRPGMLDEFDLILSAGDLDPKYLEFLVTMARCPLIYVHGNHDDSYGREPQGCICADDTIVECGGLRILGLGGSNRYREGAYMYTEKQMQSRIRKLWLPLKKHHGFDILLTHAPCRGYGDMEDIPHQGFQCFNSLLERCKPKYHVYGHVHKEYSAHGFQRMIEHPSGTTLVNANGYQLIEL